MCQANTGNYAVCVCICERDGDKICVYLHKIFIELLCRYILFTNKIKSVYIEKLMMYKQQAERNIHIYTYTL